MKREVAIHRDREFPPSMSDFKPGGFITLERVSVVTNGESCDCLKSRVKLRNAVCPIFCLENQETRGSVFNTKTLAKETKQGVGGRKKAQTDCGNGEDATRPQKTSSHSKNFKEAMMWQSKKKSESD